MIMIVLSYLLAAVFLVWYAIPYVLRRAQAYALMRQCREQRVICLTYDDGPSVSVTTRIAHLLGDFGAKATFFVVGQNLHAKEEIVSLILDKGHEIGSHSYWHMHAWKKSPLAVYRDIAQGLLVAQQIKACNLFRPPYGKVTAVTMLQAWLSGFRLAWWTVDSSDTWRVPKAIKDVLQEIRVKGGGVVLLHDNARPDAPDRECYVLDLTRAILEMARNEGFSVCKMTDISGSSPVSR
jgi:peptidoglycan-N-acetylglucosamine deacetylase